MSHQFYDLKTLENGAKQMVQLIKEHYGAPEDLVLPKVNPGYLRRSLPDSAPEHGESIEYLLQRTKNAIIPGLMNWQSPKFFGYYPHSINVTSVIAEMFTTTFHTPNFSYTVAPSYTELENIVLDWSAKALGLPSKFFIKNSGGGTINGSTSQSIFVSVHAAKFKKMKELGLTNRSPQILKLVGYFGEGSHLSSERALLIKDTPYRRSIPYIYNQAKLNYELDFEYLARTVEEDIQNGLIPFWIGLSWGNTFSGAIDVDEKAISFCKAHGLWVNIDAAFLGNTWICSQNRPSSKILEQTDSLQVNFTMLLLSGTGGSLFFVGEKRSLNESFGANALSFSIYKNSSIESQDVVEYKDWVVGQTRRNNALKLYYTFTHYGLERLRAAINQQERKGNHVAKIIEAHDALFHVHAIQFATILFQLKDRSGKPSNKLTKELADRVKNIKEGFSTPNEFHGCYFMRIAVGNFHTSTDHIDTYVDAIAAVGKEIQGQSSE